jgi:hypothetical protein
LLGTPIAILTILEFGHGAADPLYDHYTRPARATRANNSAEPNPLQTTFFATLTKTFQAFRESLASHRGQAAADADAHLRAADCRSMTK